MKLDYHIWKSAVNGYLAFHIDPKPRPTFFNIADAYPELDLITQAYPAIRAEFDQLMAAGVEMPQYHDVNSGEREISSTTPKRWNVYVLEVLGYKVEPNRARCPRNLPGNRARAECRPGILLDPRPGKSVPEHEGPYLGYLRYHLGVHVPRNNPPKITVNGRDYVWKEGEGVLFDDSWPHAVVNNSDDLRAVLIVDVRRPLPLTGDLVNRFVTNVVGRYAYGRAVARKADQFTRLQFS